MRISPLPFSISKKSPYRLILHNLACLPIWLFLISVSVNLAAQTSTIDNKPAAVVTSKPFPSGNHVVGVFEGRTPCTGIAVQLKGSVPAGCIKLKWRFILLKDPVTQQPTTYQILGTLYRDDIKEGKWSIIGNNNATIYKLETGNQNSPLMLYKGDENVLFFLDEKLNFRVGDRDFSFTLNRVMKANK